MLDGIQVDLISFPHILHINADEPKAELTTFWTVLLKHHLFYMVPSQEDFYALVDWAFKLDPLSCISMHGITDRYLSGQKAEVSGYVQVLLDDLETRITILFSRV